MALNKEDRSDVKKHLGAKMASKVSDATRDHSGSLRRIKEAGSTYNAKYSLYTKKGWERNRASITGAKDKALSKKLSVKSSGRKEKVYKHDYQKNPFHPQKGHAYRPMNKVGYRKDE